MSITAISPDPEFTVTEGTDEECITCAILQAKVSGSVGATYSVQSRDAAGQLINERSATVARIQKP